VNEVSTAQAIEHLLHRHGLRATAQRRSVLAVFRPGEHLAADDVIARLDAGQAGIDRATVYRTLERFRDLGIVSETDLGGGTRRFELLEPTPHHHLICLACQQTITLEDTLVVPLRDEIQVRYGFAPRIEHLAIFGYCAACQKLASDAP
jgi:Fur family ferric uptake transcriptional regulator